MLRRFYQLPMYIRYRTKRNGRVILQLVSYPAGIRYSSMLLAQRIYVQHEGRMYPFGYFFIGAHYLRTIHTRSKMQDFLRD